MWAGALTAYAAQIFKICIVGFGDTARLVWPLTTDVASVRAFLVDAVASTDPAYSAFLFDGGGAKPENGVDALALALDTLDAAGVTMRRFIFFRTDAPDFAHNDNTPALVNARLNNPITNSWLDIDSGSGGGGTLTARFLRKAHGYRCRIFCEVALRPCTASKWRLHASLKLFKDESPFAGTGICCQD